MIVSGSSSQRPAAPRRRCAAQLRYAFALAAIATAGWPFSPEVLDELQIDARFESMANDFHRQRLTRRRWLRQP